MVISNKTYGENMSFQNMKQAERWAKVLNNKYGLPLDQLLDEDAVLIEKDKDLDKDK